MRLPREIYLRRLDAMRSRLAKIPADALYATPSSNLYYLTGIDFHRSERLTALLLFKDAEPVVICPEFEAERMRTMSAVARVVTWAETEDAFQKAAQLLPGASGVLAVEPSTAYDDVSRLVERRPGWRPLSAGEALGAMRMVKTPEELEAMRRAIGVAVGRFRKAFAALAPGAVESEISRLFGGENMVQFGPSSALPHGASGGRALSRDEAVLIDAWDRPEGYYYDITRSTFFGKAHRRVPQDLVGRARRADRRRSRRPLRESPASRSTRRRGGSSRRPGTASSSRTGSVTASASTSTSRPTWSGRTRRCSSPE